MVATRSQRNKKSASGDANPTDLMDTTDDVETINTSNGNNATEDPHDNATEDPHDNATGIKKIKFSDDLAVLSKTQLQSLCAMNDIEAKKTWNKEKLIESLKSVGTKKIKIDADLKKEYKRKKKKRKRNDDSNDQPAKKRRKKEPKKKKSAKPIRIRAVRKDVDEEVLEKIKSMNDDSYSSKKNAYNVEDGFLTTNRQVLRALYTKNYTLLRKLLKDENVSFPSIQRSVDNPENIEDVILRNNDLKALKIWKTYHSDQNRRFKSAPQPGLTAFGTGSVGAQTYRHRTAKIGVSRGGKLGNNAFIRDNNFYSSHYSGTFSWSFQSLRRAIIGDYLSEQFVDTLLAEVPHFQEYLLSQLLGVAIEFGKIHIAKFLSRIYKSYGGSGLNDLHYQILEGTPFQKGKLSATKKFEYDGLTPLHFAAALDTDKYLLELLAHSTYNVTSESGAKPLHFAAVSSKVDNLKLLLERGADAIDGGKSNRTPLMYAASANRPDNIRYLLEKANVSTFINQKNKSGNSALHLAAELNHVESVKALLECPEIQADQLNSKKQSALMIACMLGNIETVKALVESKKVKLTKCDNKKCSALHYAVMNSQFEIAKYLLEQKMDPRWKDSSGNTMAHYCAAYGSRNCLELIYHAGGSLTNENEWKTTPLNLALLKHNYDCFNYLLSQNDVNVNNQDSNGKTLLTLVCQMKGPYMKKHVEKLLALDADINIVDSDGNSAIHHLSKYPSKEGTKDVEIAKILINTGKADLEIANSEHFTPVMIALQCSNIPILKFLLKQEMNVKPANKKKNMLHTILGQVSCSNCAEIFDLLFAFFETSGRLEVFRSMSRMEDEDGKIPLLLCFSKLLHIPHEKALFYDPDVGEQDLEVDPNCTVGSDNLKSVTGKSTNRLITFFRKYLKLTESTANISVQPVRDENGTLKNRDVGYSPLHYAVKLKNLKLIQWLLNEALVDVNATDIYSITPLHLAIKEAKSDYSMFHIAQYLILKGADTNMKDSRERSILHMALEQSVRRTHGFGWGISNSSDESEPIELFSTLCVIDGMEIDCPDAFGRTPFHYACSNGYTICSMCLLARGADINRKDEDGNTPLALCLMAGFKDFAVTLINKGADVTCQLKPLLDCSSTLKESLRKSKNKQTATVGRRTVGRSYKTARKSVRSYDNSSNLDSEAVSIFKHILSQQWMGLAYFCIENGMNPTQAVEDALTLKSYEIVISLLSKTRAEAMRTVNEEKRNLFHILSRVRDDSDRFIESYAPKIARRLLAHKVSLQQCDNQGYNPVHYAAKRGSTALVKFFIDLEEVDFNQKDSQRGMTALMYAVRSNDENMVRLILERSDVSVNIQDNNGWTVAHHVVLPHPFGTFENVELLKLFKKAGIDFNIEDKDGKKAIDYAYLQSRPTLANYLKKHTKNPKKNVQSRVSPGKSIIIPPEPSIDSDFEAEKLILEQKYKDEEMVDERKDPLLQPDPHFQIPHLEVVVEDDLPFNILLNKAEVKYGTFGLNNFYILQLCHHKIQNLYFLFNRYGRVGEEGQHQRTPFSTLEQAKAEFMKIYKSKTGNVWPYNPDTFIHHSGKYKWIDRRRGDKVQDLIKPIDLKDYSDSKLNPSLQELMHLLLDSKILREQIVSRGISTNYFDISNISRSQLAKGMEILKKLEAQIEKFTKSSDIPPKERRVEYEKIFDLSSEYYSLIPHTEFENSSIRPIDQVDSLHKSMKTLQNVMEFELTNRILIASQYNKDINPLDYSYNALQSEITDLSSKSSGYRLCKKYIRNTSSVEILNVYQIDKSDDFKFSKSENRMLLWHGSSSSNAISIIRRGLKVHGMACDYGMFGPGVYFASQFSKSMNYCDVNSKGIRCMFLFEVCLGKVYECTQAEHMVKPKPSYDSTMGLGSNTPKSVLYTPDGMKIPHGSNVRRQHEGPLYLNHDEYVVYDPDRVRIRYLVLFK